MCAAFSRAVRSGWCALRAPTRCVLQIVQPGLAGLMDGSVSTLAPVFAAAFATHLAVDAFRGGPGGLDRRGHFHGVRRSALRRWIAHRTRAFLAARPGLRLDDRSGGGIGHTLPFLIPYFRIALTLAVAIVAVELGVISFIRKRYMDTPFLAAAFEVVVGGVLVFLTGILIGSS
jgi:erythrin-vacuolar iron transport family protein